MAGSRAASNSLHARGRRGTDVQAAGGSQRPSGTLYRESRADSAPRPRAIFLGSMALGDEQRPMRYGTDANRDLAGVMERIGDRRWRLILPHPRFESLLDIVEIVPME
ncbi:DUF4893 domain-containing protein [Sphingomonas aerolata]|uniref:DUF4893 domain-containing protein n=1 Tax=Sphingomonas aerolata TaxID=185951 RepID=UPI002FDFD335